MRKTPFIIAEYYHIYNRGVDKRNIFTDESDLQRFIQSMEEFNVIAPIGSIYENSFLKKEKSDQKSQLGNPIPKLVDFICYCLNPNHYHFILKPASEHGIEKFMHKLGLGYTNYFNEKEKRSGSLFQGRYKSIHIDSNEYLLHLSAYVNLNDKVHALGNPIPKLSYSSWQEFTSNAHCLIPCKKDIVLEQFKNKVEYRNFAESSLEDMIDKKIQDKEILALRLE